MADVWYTTEHDPATLESETERLAAAFTELNAQLGRLRQPLDHVARGLAALGRAMDYVGVTRVR